MILSAEEIVKRVKIEPFDANWLDPCSYRLHAAENVRLMPVTNTFALVHCVEKVYMPTNVCGLILGVIDWTVAGLIIPALLLPQDWSGHPVITVFLAGLDPVNVVKGDTIAQVRFEIVK